VAEPPPSADASAVTLNHVRKDPRMTRRPPTMASTAGSGDALCDGASFGAGCGASMDVLPLSSGSMLRRAPRAPLFAGKSRRPEAITLEPGLVGLSERAPAIGAIDEASVTM